MKDYSIYKCFNGEKENPFDRETQAIEHKFWFYESIFERDYSERDRVEWFEFFSDYGMGDVFMKILLEDDYNKPIENNKKLILGLWLKYLFSEKLYGEYGGENLDKDAYFAITSAGE